MAQNAIQSIARLGEGDPSLVPFFIKSFANEHGTWVADVAVQALTTEYKQAAFQPLIQALASSSREVRLYATKTLGALGNPNALEPLKQRLEIESDEWVKKEIERSIGLLTD